MNLDKIDRKILAMVRDAGVAGTPIPHVRQWLRAQKLVARGLLLEGQDKFMRQMASGEVRVTYKMRFYISKTGAAALEEVK